MSASRLPQNSRPSFRGHAGPRVNLLHGSQVGEQGGNVSKTSAEAMHQPVERVEFLDTVDLFRIPVKHVMRGSESGRCGPAA